MTVSDRKASMHFRNPYHPTDKELRAWAAEADAPPPLQDWDLIVSWQMDPDRLRLCVELAAEQGCPRADFFLDVLYAWVEAVARDDSLEIRGAQYDRWLDVARGVADPTVKRWRHRARLIFQQIEPFDWQAWWDQRRSQP
jgi:hypothetical protein